MSRSPLTENCSAANLSSPIDCDPHIRLKPFALIGAQRDFARCRIPNLASGTRPRAIYNSAVAKFISIRRDDMRHTQYFSLTGFALTSAGKAKWIATTRERSCANRQKIARPFHRHATAAPGKR
jgi:hypothetical protein